MCGSGAARFLVSSEPKMDRYVAGWKAGGAPPPPTTVFVIRHGESTHNAQAFHPADINDGAYIDADLTARGRAQAAALQDTLLALAPDLVVASPMTRALRTCLLACARLPDAAPRVAVRAACAERVAYSCDIGSPVAELQARFPRVDFGSVPGPGAWWWTGGAPGVGSARESLAALRDGERGVEPTAALRARVAGFRRWLVERPERRIVVFAHGVFLRHLVAPSPRELGAHFNNCEVRKILL